MIETTSKSSEELNYSDNLYIWDHSVDLGLKRQSVYSKKHTY